MRANCIAFPISPRNSPIAVAHLISKTEVRHILVGRESAMEELTDAALEIIRDQYPSVEPPKTSPMPLFEELYLSQTETAITAQDVPYIFKGPDAIAMILHSSGSTAFPKTIYWTNHRFSQLALIPWFGERDLTDKVFSLHVMPFYHGMGVLQLSWTASCGLVVSAFEPKCPAPVPTADALFEAAKATDSNITFCVPSFIEAWSRNPEYVKWLTTRDGVLFGGGSLNKEAGDYMTSQGVSYMAHSHININEAEVGYDWEYFHFPDLVKPKMVPYGNNTFEFVMVSRLLNEQSNTFCEPSVLNTQVAGIGAYATSDLMVPHPTKPGYWRIHGRTDDQIMQNTGEKVGAYICRILETNPGPLENILNQDPHVLSSVMFGRGRFQAGVLIDPKPAFRFDPVDQVKLADFRNKIWPTIERMDAYAPQHSRLFKEVHCSFYIMITVAKPSKLFMYTAKNTARRQAVINDYEEEINALYDIVEESTQSSIPPPSHWDIVSAIEFVRAVVVKVLGHTVNLYLIKVDIVADYLDQPAGNMDQEFLAACFARLRTSRYAQNIAELYSSPGLPEAMQGMVAKYIGQYPTRPEGPLQPRPLEDTVLVTETTGSLGCYLLARLVEDTNVTKAEVCAQRRGLNPNIADSKKAVLLKGDLTKDNWDLPPTVYTEMHRSVMHIIHNEGSLSELDTICIVAWRVDFKLALASFESNVKGVRNLIDFSLKSCLLDSPRLIFTSSIGVFQ
ncbi:acetyl-CoA synthetase-like protein, partial [Wolfiporia cocos MD-104 SS10]